MNWGWLLVRIAIALTVLLLLLASQRFWYRSIWRGTANWKSTSLRVVVRLVYVVMIALVVVATVDGLRMGHRGRLIPTDALITIFAGLWFTSALFSYLAVKAVRGIDWLWRHARNLFHQGTAESATQPETRPVRRLTTQTGMTPAAVELVPDPSRRYFFRSATALAGATPFLTAMYGFAAERLNYQIRRVEMPVSNLPEALDGMRIVQLSDIHLSGYMTRQDVRRAVDMANELGGDIAMVTGDFITSGSDPLVDCIEEVHRLHAPLGVWGCNGNHEIYAKAEDLAQQLFAQAGMKLLRHENAQLTFRGAQFNLIGVDYQRERNPSGHLKQMLVNMEPLVRRDMPNILLSHNPNSFDRAAELGIELSLAGHTHGGQIQVEILDHRLSPARFISNYIAGLYERPLFAPANSGQHAAHSLAHDGKEPSAISRIYVNRGLGTVGAPVRLGVPPEITLLTLRRA